MKQIHSTIDWTPFVYKKTRITPYCHDFCKIDFNCEFYMSLDGFCMLGKFSKNSKIILSHQQSLMSILRTKSKWFCKKDIELNYFFNHMLFSYNVILEYFNMKNKHFLILPSSLCRYSSAAKTKTKKFKWYDAFMRAALTGQGHPSM